MSGPDNQKTDFEVEVDFGELDLGFNQSRQTTALDTDAQHNSDETTNSVSTSTYTPYDQENSTADISRSASGSYHFSSGNHSNVDHNNHGLNEDDIQDGLRRLDLNNTMPREVNMAESSDNIIRVGFGSQNDNVSRAHTGCSEMGGGISSNAHVRRAQTVRSGFGGSANSRLSRNGASGGASIGNEPLHDNNFGTTQNSSLRRSNTYHDNFSKHYNDEMPRYNNMGGSGQRNTDFGMSQDNNTGGSGPHNTALGLSQDSNQSGRSGSRNETSGRGFDPRRWPGALQSEGGFGGTRENNMNQHGDKSFRSKLSFGSKRKATAASEMPMEQDGIASNSDQDSHSSKRRDIFGLGSLRRKDTGSSADKAAESNNQDEMPGGWFGSLGRKKKSNDQSSTISAAESNFQSGHQGGRLPFGSGRGGSVRDTGHGRRESLQGSTFGRASTVNNVSPMRRAAFLQNTFGCDDSTHNESIGRRGSMRQSFMGMLGRDTDVSNVNSMPLGSNRGFTGANAPSGSNRFSYTGSEHSFNDTQGTGRRSTLHANRGLGAISSTSFNLAASLANNTNSRHLAHPREIPSDAEELARRACSLPILNLCLDNPRVDNLMVKYNNGTATEAEQTEWEDIIHGIFEDYFESGGVRPEPRRREDDYDDYYGEQMQM